MVASRDSGIRTHTSRGLGILSPMRLPVPPYPHNPEHDYLWNSSSSCLPRTYTLSASREACQFSEHLVGCTTLSICFAQWAVMESNHPSQRQLIYSQPRYHLRYNCPNSWKRFTDFSLSVLRKTRRSVKELNLFSKS